MKRKVVEMYYDNEETKDFKTWLVLVLDDGSKLVEASTDPVLVYNEIKPE